MNCRNWARWFAPTWVFVLATAAPGPAARAAPRVFRAGAAAVDVTPPQLPVIVNGYFNERTADRVHDPLAARALVLDDGQTRLALVVVDSLMMPRALLDDAKQKASAATGIAPERMLISATHTHTAPAAMGCLGSRADDAYRRWLPARIARSVALAAQRLAPARVGWAVVQDPAHNHCRRWIFRPDRIATDPFGVRNVRAQMHPGYQSPNHIGPAGPADTDLSLLAVQTAAGKPLAVLANYAMHYYGSEPVSADVCGRFGRKLAGLIGAEPADPPFVGALSQGTSGDSMWMDYSQPPPARDLDAYAAALAHVAAGVYGKIEFHGWVPLAMAEATLKLARRVPDAARLAWAKSIVAQVGDRLPKTQPEIYAREQLFLDQRPEVELKLQAVRIGQLGITALPNEVYGLTGLKLKARSPLQPTFNIELAGGAEGYIPPPEQHALGGYTTWPARTAALETQAEPKIVETLVRLLEKVSGEKARQLVDPVSPYATAVLAARPAAYWRLGEMAGTIAQDATGRHDGRYEPGTAFYLPGPAAPGLMAGPRGNRAAQMAGGRVRAAVGQVGSSYSVELWFWNGLPADARPVTGYFFSMGQDQDPAANGDHLGIGGTHGADLGGKLIFFNGNRADQVLVGRTRLPLRTWNHVALVRDGTKVIVYLNGQREPEIRGEAAVTRPAEAELFLGGRCDGFAPLAGRLDEVAWYNRVLTADQIAEHFRASGYQLPAAATAAAAKAAAAKAAAAKDAAAKDAAAKDAAAKDAAAKPQLESQPLSPAESLAALHVRAGYRAELVAAEPLVVDPVAIAWGPDGRLWVAEMHDYPLGMDGKGAPGGRIRYLEDTDGDGRYDRSTVFLDKINFPNGVMPWRNGVLVTAAPELFYAEDTDGDGHADKRKVLLSGFLEGNQQLRVNGLRWGLDNWVYCASGSHQPGYGAKSRIRSHKTGQLVALGSRDFRFRPDTGQIDPQSGPTQFGRTRDDWGNWFGCMNSRPLWHFVLADHYLRRNPFFAPPDPRKQVVVPLNPRLFPAKSPQKRYHSFQHSGRFTSACSPMVYRDDLLFPRSVQAAQLPAAETALGSGDESPAGPATRADSAATGKTVNDSGSRIRENSGRSQYSPKSRDFGNHQKSVSSSQKSRSRRFPTRRTQHTFTCGPTHNLVQHNILLDDGVSFRAERDQGDGALDFFASRDRWCRPVMVRTGPDGALWVVDMYRYMIEHPQWLPPLGRKELEPFYRSGDDRGRIYRILPVGAEPRPFPRLDRLPTDQLVATLESSNGIVRDLVQQLLLQRADRTAVEPLRQLVAASSQPLARLHALCTLAGLDALNDAMLQRALCDPHPAVRRHAVRLAEHWAADAPALRRAAAALVDDPDSRVRLQLACTLGAWPDEDSARALGRLAVRDAGDRYLAAAVMSSVSQQNIDRVLAEVLARRASGAAGGLVGRLLAMSVSLGAHQTTLGALVAVLEPADTSSIAWQDGIVAGLLDALQQRGSSLAELAAVNAQQGAVVLERIGLLIQRARTDLLDDQAGDGLRAAAARLLGRDAKTRTADIDLLAELLVPQISPDLQKEVIDHLGTLSDAAVAPALLAGWSSLGPAVRTATLRILSSRKAWLVALLDAIQQGQVVTADIDAGSRQTLLVYGDRAIRQRIERLLASSGSEDRQQVLQQYLDVLDRTGSAAHGAVLFKEKCSTCHQVADVGYNVGPNLLSITDPRPVSLLTSMLDPSAAVDGKFVTYIVLTVDGRTFSGILASETGSSITLLGQDDKRQVILRNQVDELRSTGKSLMPDGLEKELSRQDLADLIGYLRSLRHQS